MFYLLFTTTLLAFAAAQYNNQQHTTPVPILKQINKHNEDGSYSYGYEAADGTYKIETKYPNGEVFGKYGYVDDQGKVRSIEYGASRRGFEPSGNEIQVPPPTLNNEYAQPLGPNQEDDGQYREDPSVYYKDEPYARQQPQAPRYQQPRYQQPQPQPAFRPQTSFNNFEPVPTPSYNNYNNNNYQQPRYYQPAPPAYPNYNAFQGHPATNVDLNSGSYTVNYKK